MTGQKLTSLEAVDKLQVLPERKFHSATHEEIAMGATTDIYFVRTYEILSHLGKLNTRVTAEIFPRRAGVMAGTEEVVNLLREQEGVKVWALAEGEEFAAKEVIMRIEGPYSEFGLYETVVLGMLASPCGWATAARECKKSRRRKGGLCLWCQACPSGGSTGNGTGCPHRRGSMEPAAFWEQSWLAAILLGQYPTPPF